MSTLVSFLLAAVMQILSPTASNTSEIIHLNRQIDVEEVIFYLEDLPTITPIKNC